MTQPDRSTSSQAARRAIRNMGVLAAASLLSKGLLFGWQIVLGNWLGPSDYGIYNTVFAILAIAAILPAFGMGLIAIRDMAQRPQEIGRYWSAMLFVQTGLAIVAYLGSIVAAIGAGYSESVLAFTALAGLSLFVDLFGNISYDLLIARERMIATSSVEVGHIVFRILLSGVALVSGLGLFGIYLAALIAGLARSVTLTAFNWHYGHRPEWPLDKVLLQTLLINSAPLALSAFLSLAYQHADKLMTSAILGETNTGYLGPAFVINFGIIELFSTTVLVAMYPLLARYHAQGGEIFGFLVSKLARFMFLLCLPMILALIVFADDLILWIYSPDYTPTIRVLQWLMVYTLLTMVGNVFSKALLIQNRQRWLLAVRAMGLALNITLNALFLWLWRDALGAVIASA